jgi:hypothetical protein
LSQGHRAGAGNAEVSWLLAVVLLVVLLPSSAWATWPYPYGWWRFNEDPAQDGTTALDSGVGSNVGTFSTGDGATNKSVPGRFIKAYALDGVNDFVSIANQANFNFDHQQFTISAWVKDVTGLGTVVSKVTTGAVNGWVLLVSATGLSMITMDATGAHIVSEDATFSQPFNDGQWHMVTAVVGFDTTTAGNNFATVYVDGVSIAQTNSGVGGTPTLSAEVVRWGSSSAATFLPGKIDEGQIYDVGLTSDEISFLYWGAPQRSMMGVGR